MRRLGTQNRLDTIVGEPWRYECTECGSYDVRRLYASHQRKDKDYTADGSGRYEARSDAEKSWRCEDCNERLDEVYDAKENRVRPINTIL